MCSYHYFAEQKYLTENSHVTVHETIIYSITMHDTVNAGLQSTDATQKLSAWANSILRGVYMEASQPGYPSWLALPSYFHLTFT